MLKKLLSLIRPGRKDPMKLSAWEIWQMGKTIMKFDFVVFDHSRKLDVGSLRLSYRGDWGRTPELRVSIEDERVFDVYHAGNEMHVSTFRPGLWLIEYDQLWRQAECKRRLQGRIENRENFDPI